MTFLVGCKLNDNSIGGSLGSGDLFSLPSLAEKANAPLGQLVYSPIISISKFSGSYSFSVSGDGSPEFRTCSKGDSTTTCDSSVLSSWSTSANFEGSAAPFYLQIRTTAKSTYSAESIVTLTVQESSIQWRVITANSFSNCSEYPNFSKFNDFGSGTPEDPFVLCNANQFTDIALSGNLAALDADYKLMNNIDLSAYTGNTYPKIGDMTNAFTGNLDGNNYEIQNLNFVDPAAGDYFGLFGRIQGGFLNVVKISNLVLRNIQINAGSAKGVGAIVGYSNYLYLNNVSLENISVTSTGDDIGGISGTTYYSSYFNVTASGVVSGGNNVGGFNGHHPNYSAYVKESASTVNVTGANSVGGIVGRISCSSSCNSQKVTIEKVSYNGNVVGQSDVGGLVGTSNTLKVLVSSSFGDISGDTNVGGLIGNAAGIRETIKYSASHAKVTAATNNAGGLVGNLAADPINSISYSFAGGIGGVTSGGTAGGIVGTNAGTLTDLYWNAEISTQGVMCGANSGTGCDNSRNLTDAQSKNIATYVSANWDFSGLADGPNDYWALNGSNYPVPWYFQLSPTLPSFSGGSGTDTDPFQIAAADDLDSIGANPHLMDKNFVVTADINLGSKPAFNTIGNSDYVFRGTFDGNGHTLSNLTISAAAAEDFVGLFGVMNASVEIRDLNLDGFIVNGGQYYVGSLGGFCLGLFENISVTNVDINPGGGSRHVGGMCGAFSSYAVSKNLSVTGNIDGASKVGGIFGTLDVYYQTTLEGFSTNVTVNGSGTDTGGVIGYLSSTNGRLKQITSSGVVSGNTNVGGLVGNLYSSRIEDSSSSATVSGVTTVGGAIGDSNRGTLVQVSATGNVQGTSDFIGGVIGDCFKCHIQSCFATGNVQGLQKVGGVAGYGGGYEFKWNYYKGTVTGNSLVGGIAGSFNGYSGGTRSWNNNFAIATIVGNDGVNNKEIGGFAGRIVDYDTINNNYVVTTIIPGTGTTPKIGGFVGNHDANLGTMQGNFWNTTVAGAYNDFGVDAGAVVDHPNVFAESTANMTDVTGAIYNAIPWNFTDYWQLDVGATNNGYPILIPQSYCDLWTCN